MSMINWVLARLRFGQSQPEGAARDAMRQLQLEVLIQAHGDWLTLLATILEREHIIRSDELARSLSEFAALTAEDRPAEGLVLSYWALRITDAAASLRDFPSVQ